MILCFVISDIDINSKRYCLGSWDYSGLEKKILRCSQVDWESTLINECLTLIYTKCVPGDPSYIFGNQFYSKNTGKFLCIPLFLFWKIYDTIILPEVDRILKKLWTLFQFSLGPRTKLAAKIYWKEGRTKRDAGTK